MATTSTAPSYDLTAKIAAHLDPHMILPLLDFAEANGSFDRHTLNRARLQILQKTQMVDFFNDIYVDEFGDDEPHDCLVSRPRDAVVEQYTKLKADCASLLDLLEERKGDIADRAQLTAATILENRQVDPAQVEALYTYAKFMFDCGQYQDAAEFLFFYRILSSNEERCFKALWGQLAADILLTHWDDALVGLNQLSDSIDQMSNAPQISLVKYRTWLIHWGLFVFFNHQNGRASLIEFLNKERNLITMQTSCPHILRYIVTACVIRRRRNALLDLVKLITKLAYLYSDPVTQFLQALYVDYDFATAFAKLAECDRILSDDFFLSYIKDEFIDSARLFYFETYFRAHQTISIQQVAESLGVGMDEAERWTVELIRSLGLEARIDLHKNEVVMAKEFPSVYQSVIDKTKSLTFRTNQLVSLVDKKYLSLQD